MRSARPCSHHYRLTLLVLLDPYFAPYKLYLLLLLNFFVNPVLLHYRDLSGGSLGPARTIDWGRTGRLVAGPYDQGVSAQGVVQLLPPFPSQLGHILVSQVDVPLPVHCLSYAPVQLGLTSCPTAATGSYKYETRDIRSTYWARLDHGMQADLLMHGGRVPAMLLARWVCCLALWYCPTDTREARGLGIVAKGDQIKKTSGKRYLVKSQTVESESYEVAHTVSGWSCSCPDYRFRKVHCKHICAVKPPQVCAKESCTPLACMPQLVTAETPPMLRLRMASPRRAAGSSTGRRSSPGGRRSWGRGRGRPVCRSSRVRTWSTPFSCQQPSTMRRDPLHITHAGRHDACGSGYPACVRTCARAAACRMRGSPVKCSQPVPGPHRASRTWPRCVPEPDGPIPRLIWLHGSGRSPGASGIPATDALPPQLALKAPLCLPIQPVCMVAVP